MEKGPSITERYFEKPKWLKTQSGIPVKETYTPDDIGELEYAQAIGNPGEFPFTRGIFPTMYRGRMWSMREICGYASPRATNERLKRLMSEGESALNVITDNPTQCGIDSDHPRAEGSVGLTGIPVCSLKDMEIMMAGIPIDQVSMTLSVYWPSILVMYLAAAEKQGVPLSEVRCTVTADPLEYHLCAGWYPPAMPPVMGVREAVDSLVYWRKHAPRVYLFSVGAAALRESGATAAQEIAFDFCDARHYLKEAVRRGANIDDVAPRMAFTHRVGIDIFEEAAKFRAARRVWTKLMKEEFGAKNPKSWTYKVHTVTKGSDLVPQQPENNIIRIAYQALAAVLGGVQSMHTTSFDEPIGLPTEESQRIAVRTQQILAYETGAVNVADPLGGSYYVEWLTNKLESEITEIMEELKDNIVEAVGSGRLKELLTKQAYQHQEEVENGERTVVGLNTFTIPEEEEREAKIFQVSMEDVKEHLENLKELRRTRDNSKVKECLENLRSSTEKKEENVIPAVLEAVRAYATLGEITGAMRLGYGFNYDSYGEIEYPF